MARRIGAGAAVLCAAVVLGALGMLGCSADAARINEYNSYFEQGLDMTRAGNHEEAIRLYRRAIEALPDHDKTADAYNNLGYSLAELEDYAEAVKAYEKAVELRPTFERARRNLNWTKERMAALPK